MIERKVRFVFVPIICVLLVGFALGEPPPPEQLFSYHSNSNILGNLTLPYLRFLDHLYYYLGEAEYNVSENCRSDTAQLLNLARNGNTGALKVLDSNGKPSSGILEGGVFFIGFYSECVHAAVATDTNTVHGKYCLINVNASVSHHHKVLPEASWLVLTKNSKPPTIGVCVPLSCSNEDVQYASSASVADNFDDVQAKVSVCHTDVEGFSKDVGAIIALSVILFFITIAAAATTCDFIIESRKNQADVFQKEGTPNLSTEQLCNKEKSEALFYSVPMRCLLAFSFKTNASKIFCVKRGDNIGVVHGLKFLTMALIILGHTYSFATQNLFIRNPLAAQESPKDFLFQILANGTFAVDTFYLISGLLVAYVTLKAMEKMDGKLPLIYFYVHRYFRLTPLMMAVVLFCAYLLRYINSGPNWLSSIMMYDEWCKANGWTNLLYLHNFVNTEHMCLSHTWYLATDMQMYLVAPLILIPLFRNIKYGILSMGIFLSVSVLTTALITAINHYPAIPYSNNVVPLDIVNAYYKNIYIKPYCRIGPYVIGIAVGYFLLRKKELVLKRRTLAVIWCASTAAALAVLYLMWPATKGYLPTNAEAAAYSSLARNVWAVSISWLIIACYYGYGGFINSILSFPLLIPLSRLSYCAYLIHPVVMNAYYGSTEFIVDFSRSFMLYTFLGNLCITYALSVFLSLLFESPFVGLEKVLLSKKSS